MSEHTLAIAIWLLTLANAGLIHALEKSNISRTQPGPPPSTIQLRLQPPQVSIVLVGGQSYIQVQCVLPTPHYRLQAKPHNPHLVKILTDDVLLNTTASTTPSSSDTEDELLTALQLLGLRPGRTKLDLILIHAGNRTVVRRLSWDFEVVVVERLNALKDGFLYLLLAAQMAALTVLVVRMRGTAVKEVLKRPCSLFSAIFCQAVLVPLVSIGVSVCLGLPIHAVVCLLILGCCPTGPLSPMLTVIQQGHVELSILVVLIEACAAFGIMPLWLFAYGNFLGLAYDHVSAPYYFIAGALFLTATPVIIGVIVQKVAPGSFHLLDRVIPPSCLLLMLLQFTVNATAFAAIWDVTTWRLLAGSGLVPVLGGILGTICTATFRQELPQSKAVTVVTCVQNTILAKVIIQMSYPVPDASVMVLTLTCVDFFTICYMLLAYIPHLSLMLCWPAYRPLLQHTGIGGLQDSIGDQIVRSMVKAGEITFGKLQSSPVFKRIMGSEGFIATGNVNDTEQGPGQFGSLKGRLMYTSNTLDSAYRSGVSSSRCSTPTGYPLKYFTDSNPDFIDRTFLKGSGGIPIDSLESLDYEMLSDGEHPGEDLPIETWGSDKSNVNNANRQNVDREVMSEQRRTTPSPERSPQQKLVPRFDSLDVRKPLPPIPLPPTPPYLSRRLSCSDEAIHRSDVRARAYLHPANCQTHRLRHTSANSSKSVRSDATQDTSVGSRPCDMEDLSESVSTIMASYDMSLMAAAAGRATTGTRWQYTNGDVQYSPPPPNSSPARGLMNDLSSIEEEQSVDEGINKPGGQLSEIYQQLPCYNYKDSVSLSY